MIEQTHEKKKGLHGNAIRVWALLMLTIGIAGQSIIQNQLLGMGDITTAQLLELMNADPSAMAYVTVALVCKLAEACATPLFAMLLVEGFLHTFDLKKYLLRVLGVALVSEIPYNLAMSGSVLDFNSRNPAFGVVLALVMLWMFSRYQEKGLKNTVIKLFIALAAVVWARMLGIAEGQCIIIISGAVWAYRNKPGLRTLAACAATAVCTLFSVYYLAAPMSCMFIHMYNGEPGERNRKVNYLAYPVILTILAVCANLL